MKESQKKAKDLAVGDIISMGFKPYEVQESETYVGLFDTDRIRCTSFAIYGGHLKIKEKFPQPHVFDFHPDTSITTLS